MRRSFLVLAGVWAAFSCEREPPATDPAPAVEPNPPAPAAEPEPTPARQGPPIRKDGTVYGQSELMGTSVSINVWIGANGDSARAAEAMNAALAEMARIERLMSEWQPDTELSRLNRAAGTEPLALSPELFEVLQRSKKISQATDGAFDVTFHGVGQLWSFKPGAKPPDPKAIAERLHLIDWQKIELQPEGRRARLAEKGMAVGLGAIAKGYAVDRGSRVLVDAGFPHHVVEAGGDTYVSGTKDGKPWMIGVQNPQGAGTIGALPMSDRSVVTSGDYQRFFEYEGRRYAHILDPRTGWPVAAERSPKSVTLVAANATDADAYCTAVAVMGVDKGMEFVESRDDLEAVIITQDDEVRISKDLQAVFISSPAAKP